MVTWKDFGETDENKTKQNEYNRKSDPAVTNEISQII